MQALRIIRDEHRSLAAIIHGLLYLVRDVRERGATPDFRLLGAMIYYIDTFPERHHHPKEDLYLFSLLRARCPDAIPRLDELERDHASGVERMRNLQAALARYEHGGRQEFPVFAAEVESYATFHWEHMHKEERDVLPLAEAAFTAGDWEAIDAAFLGNIDPLAGVDADAGWDELFRRIVHLAPPPIGVGPMR